MTDNSPENPRPGDQQPPAGQGWQGPPAPYGQPAYTQPGYQQPSPYGQPPQAVPGKVMGIVAVILPFVGFGLVGLILGIIARIQSKKAGYKNTPALWAIILGAASIVVASIAIVVGVVLISTTVNDIQQQCDSSTSNGQYTLNGKTITCPTVN